MTEQTKDNMANLLESIAKQPIDPNFDPTKWSDVAMPLVRKVFAEINKPNGVLFKNDVGRLILCLIKENEFDWDNLLVLNKAELLNEHEDSSSQDLSEYPFEYVFVRVENDKFTTTNQKTTIPNYTFTKLYDEGKLFGTIQKDYEKQYGPI